MKIPLDISYLGDRDYIDVSTLSSALYQALPDITINSHVTDFKIRLLKKVLFNCELVWAQDLEPDFDKKKLCVHFNWKFKDQLQSVYFQELSTLITSRKREPMTNPTEHMAYQSGEVHLFDPINDDSIYNLMKMGRILVVEKYHLIPRVVRFKFDRLLNQSELRGVTMKADFFAKEDFYILETFKNNNKFGEIIIKGLPYK